MSQTKLDIRTPASHRREEASKAAAERLLLERGFNVQRVEPTRNRHYLHVIDPASRSRVLWLKIGWSPGKNGTSAVQITMLKRDDKLGAPSGWSDDAVLETVEATFGRARNDGATDMLLFSLDEQDVEPIVALIVPIEFARKAFKNSMDADRARTRKGASPSLWLRGNTNVTKRLAEIVHQHAAFDLLSGALGGPLRDEDALADMLQAADRYGAEVPDKLKRLIGTFKRDAKVRNRVLDRADGRCEYCNRITFLARSGVAYLEAHHVLALSAEGPDTEQNVIALCPEHHREAHYGADWERLAEKMSLIAEERAQVYLSRSK